MEDGKSGVYQIRNVNKETIAFFTPFDEEPNTSNNTKGYDCPFGSESFRTRNFFRGASIREEATYLLESFSRNKYKFDIPATSFVEICHKTFNINIEEMNIKDKKNC